MNNRGEIWKISDIYNGENIDDKAVVLVIRNNQVYIPTSKLEENIDIIEENCDDIAANNDKYINCLLYTSPSPRD